jgi:LPS export ABC transporter permease LptG
VASAFLSHLALVMAAFCSLYILIEFTDLLDDVRTNRVKGAVVFHYYLFHTPAIAHLMIPMSVLVAVLITFGILSRRNELTAMKAGGISLYRAVLPTLAMAVLLSATLFALGEYVMPRANRVAGRDFNTIKGRPPQSSSFLERRWILGSDGRFYNYEYLDEGRPGVGVSLYGLSVYDVDAATWTLRDHLHANRALWDPSTRLYTIEKGWRRRFTANRATLETKENVRTREIEPPDYFKRTQPESDTLRFGELRSHIDALEALGLDVIRLRVQLQKKLAFPLVTVVMTLIGVPFAFVVARKGALYGIAISILVAIVYWACLGIFEALGNNALLPPLLAAWAPNVLFGAAGLYFMFNLET